MNEQGEDKNQKEKPNNAFPELIKNYPGIILASILCLILGIIFVTQIILKKEDKEAVHKTPEKREVFETKYFDESVKKRSGSEEAVSQYPQGKRISNQRKLDSKIEVFVQQESNKAENEITRIKPEGEREEKIGLSSGTLIPARVQGTIFSFNTKAPVICSVTKDIQQDGKLLIPKNSRFLGEADVIKSINRINVAFHLLIFPDGCEMRVRAMAVSADSSSGIKGRVNKHHDQRALKAVGETLLAGASLFTGSLPSAEPYSLQDELRMNLAQNLTHEAAQDLKTERIDASITVENFTPIQVLLLDGI
ncbi:MAG: TrbI/VirB10 family protein [Candidatus Omnitrophica bacterium]|nr:TrbI/VirB10 family protein [Candidatus Omnitrophota bacterium]